MDANDAGDPSTAVMIDAGSGYPAGLEPPDAPLRSANTEASHLPWTIALEDAPPRAPRKWGATPIINVLRA
jgi:hypothetical protein